jgi:hypothetical protein
MLASIKDDGFGTLSMLTLLVLISFIAATYLKLELSFQEKINERQKKFQISWSKLQTS